MGRSCWLEICNLRKIEDIERIQQFDRWLSQPPRSPKMEKSSALAPGTVFSPSGEGLILAVAMVSMMGFWV